MALPFLASWRFNVVVVLAPNLVFLPFDGPFGRLRVLSNVEGLRVPSIVEGVSWWFMASAFRLRGLPRAEGRG
jgi:hypothetical protein